MKKNIKLLIIFILGLFFIIPSTYAIEVSKDDILYNSYVIGTYLYTTDENDIFNTTGLDTVYNENSGLFTKEIMLAATSITKMEYENMIIYYKDFWDEWGDALTGDVVEIEDTFEITHVNGICIDPSCSGNKVTVTLKYNNETDSDVIKSVAYGTVFGKPETPTRLGYKFVCWEISDGNCYEFNQEVTDNIVLSAKWEVYSYKITFVNSVNESDTKIVTCDFASADQCSYNDFETVFSAVPEGYTFMGWSTAKTGEKVYTSSNYSDLFSDIVYVDNDSYDVKITLYSIFNSGTSKISYQLNGGTFNTVASPITTYDPSVMTYTLLNPVKKGYTFNKWKVVEGEGKAEKNDEETSTLTIDKFENITLEAQWETHTYTLIYNGKTLASCTYDVYCSIDESVLDIPEGKELTKLEVEVSSGNFIEIGNKVKNLTTENNASLKVRATIETIKHNIYYDYNGGSVSDSNVNKVELNSETNLNVPTKTGYTFNEWKVSEGASIVDNKLTLNNPKDVYIEALWIPNTYTLNYNDDVYVTCTYDVECSIPDLTRDKIGNGNVFNGWYILKGEDKVYLGSSINNLLSSGSVTIYADITPIKYSVSYEYNGGIVNTANAAKISVGSTIDLTIPAKTGYTFKEWKVSEGATISGDKESGYKLTLSSESDVSVTAIWTANTYKLVYNNTDYATCTYDQTCEVKDLDTSVVPAGKEFLRWKDKNDKLIGSSVYNYTTSGVVEISPVYTLITYPIVYSYNGGTIVSENTVSYDVDNMSIKLSNPTKAGYTFDRWKVETSNASVTGDTLTINKVGEVRLTAIWNANTYKLVYNEGDIDPQSCAYDSSCTVSSVKPVKEGYIFKGWKYNESYMFDSNANINLITDNDATINLEAIWIEEKADVYSINYALNGGTFENTPIVTFTKADNDVLLSVPTKLGYTFNGWYDNSEFTGSEVSSVNASLKKNVTLYAKWTANTYDVVLYKDVNGTEVLDTKKCTYDVTCSLGDNSLKFDGYTLLGWSKNKGGNVFYGDNLDLKNVIDSGTLNLYPVLEVNTYVVSYYLDGGSFVDESSKLTSTYAKGDSIKLPEVYKDGYTLSSWKLSDGTTVTDGQSDLTGDIVLIPVWEKRSTYTINFLAGYDTVQTMSSVECTLDEICTLPANTYIRDGYTFNYWNTDSDKYNDKSSFYYSSESAKIDDKYEIDFVANWTEISLELNIHKITYNWASSYGSGSSSINVLDGELITDLPKTIIVQNGPSAASVIYCNVVGWKFENGDDVDLSTYRVYDNLTIYAVFDDKQTS